ncbi:MAG: VWA domain-containing protein [Halieaceae bacterium]|jgi:Ca-activated chloride channel family protein|nr:VWA domain-containing protein [Halieaceae bacterium]
MDALHFLRPLWLLALPYIALVWWLARRETEHRPRGDAFLAPHLREALTIDRDASDRLRPVDGVALVMLCLAVAAAGPTWTAQLAPWFRETAPLLVAIEVTDSMRSNDTLPTRLDRARYELIDLVKARTGARTALIAYAGSAHLVMPPTKDLQVLQAFLESLDPAIMPVSGTRASEVLPIARRLVDGAGPRSTLLFVTDGFASTDIAAFAAFRAAPDAPALAALVVGRDDGGVALLPDGAPVLGPGGGPLDTRIDPGPLRAAERDAGVSVVRTTPDDSDTRALLRHISSQQTAAKDPDARWKDEAWLALWPALLLALIWFRRGWTMRW